MNVPEAFVPKMVDEPIWIMAVLELWIGEPERERAVTFDPVSPRVVPVAFVNVSVPPCRYPEAEMFVVETFVNAGLTEKPMISVPVADTVDTWILVPEALKVSVGCEELE